MNQSEGFSVRFNLRPLFLSQSSSSLSSGTHLRFHSGSNVEWQDVEDLDSAEEDSGDVMVHCARSLWLHLDLLI